MNILEWKNVGNLFLAMRDLPAVVDKDDYVHDKSLLHSGAIKF